MNFFWFERSNSYDIKEISLELEKSGFYGVLLVYSFYSDDQFVKIANAIDVNQKIKYMVAIRPHVISPQYLSMINNSFQKISKDRIIINFITGWISEYDKQVGGIQGEVNDLSSNLERSENLVEYLKVLKNTAGETPNFYVSVTNPILLEKVSGDKVIIPYQSYKQNNFSTNDSSKIMIYISPVIRKTREELLPLIEKNTRSDVQHFTFDEFEALLNELKNKNINNILMDEAEPNEYIEKKHTLSFVSYFTNKETNILGGKNDTP